MGKQKRLGGRRPMNRVLLDTTRIHERRLALGLSQRRLARAAGVTSATIKRLETDENHSELNLSLVADIAAALQLHIIDMFVRDAPGKSGPHPAEDDVRLEALLAASDMLLSRAAIGRALDWKHRYVNETISTLRARLAGTGQCVHDGPSGTVGLRARPGVLTNDDERSLAAVTIARRSITATMAQMMRAALADELPAQQDHNDKRVNLGSLVKSGVVVLDGKRARLSDDARYSLMPDTGIVPD
jgi:transcriptional regulator with XRE-family HTH domain